VRLQRADLDSYLESRRVCVKDDSEANSGATPSA
jgi:hypothetical protein